MQRESRQRRISGWAPQFQEAQGQLLLRSRELTLLVDARRGGRLLELSDKRAQRNLLAARAGAGWLEHLFVPGTQVRDFAQGKAKEMADLSVGLYEARLEEGKDFVKAVLSRQAETLKFIKTITLPALGRKILFSHRITNTSERPKEFLFGAEITLSLKDAHVNRTGEAPGVRRFAVLDPAARLQVSWVFDRPARLWHFPLEAGSGAQRVYQGVKLTGLWPVKLLSNRSWAVRWELKIEEPGGWRAP